MRARILLIASAIVLLAGPAGAQGVTLGGGGREMPDPNAAEKRQKAQELDEAYKSGLKSIPDTKQKADPWGSVRNSEPAPGKKSTR